MSMISKAFRMTKATNAILSKAGTKMIKSSFNTAKQIAVLYKDAGVATYRIGKDVVTGTFKLALDNQKTIIKTSGEAIKEAAQQLRQKEEAKAKATAKRKRKARKSRKKKELSIDDLLPQEK